MWVLFDGGRFVAVVKYDPALDPKAPARPVRGNVLLVRSRVRRDLVEFLALASKLKGDHPGPVRNTPEADYPFRAIVPASHVARCLMAATFGMRYTSLKKSIPLADYRGRLRYSVAVGAWSELGELEVLNPPGSSKKNPQVFHRNPQVFHNEESRLNEVD